MLVSVDFFLLAGDLGGLVVYIGAGKALLHGLDRIVVILQIENPKFALHHIEVSLILFEFVAQSGEAIAPPFFVVVSALRSICGVSRSAIRIVGSWGRLGADRGNSAVSGNIVVREDLGLLGCVLLLFAGPASCVGERFLLSRSR